MKPQCRESILGKVPGHLWSTAKVPMSKILNPQMVILGPVMNWQLIEGWTLPSPIVNPPGDPRRNKVVQKTRIVKRKAVVTVILKI